MVEYKVVRISDNVGSISVVVQIPSLAGRIVPITFNPDAFEKMSKEEVEYAVQEMIDNMFKRPATVSGGVIVKNKVDIMREAFGVDRDVKPLFESSRMKEEVKSDTK